MDKDTPRFVLDVPLQVSDGSSTIGVLTDREQRDLHYDADGTGRSQVRSIPNSSIGRSENGTPSSSTTGPSITSTIEGGAENMLLLFCSCKLFCASNDDRVADADGLVELADEGDDDEEECPAETFHDDDDNRHPEGEIAGWDDAIADDDSEHRRHTPTVTPRRRRGQTRELQHRVRFSRREWEVGGVFEPEKFEKN
jgi:hypothetical protein